MPEPPKTTSGVSSTRAATTTCSTNISSLLSIFPKLYEKRSSLFKTPVNTGAVNAKVAAAQRWSRRRCEVNAALLQRDRSSLSRSAASMSRPAATSASESARAAWSAARSASSSQSPGSSGSSSTSVPSGRSVGSSTTSRPARTRAFIVVRRSVAFEWTAHKRLHPAAALQSQQTTPGMAAADLFVPALHRHGNARHRHDGIEVGLKRVGIDRRAEQRVAFGPMYFQVACPHRCAEDPALVRAVGRAQISCEWCGPVSALSR